MRNSTKVASFFAPTALAVLLAAPGVCAAKDATAFASAHGMNMQCTTVRLVHVARTTASIGIFEDDKDCSKKESKKRCEAVPEPGALTLLTSGLVLGGIGLAFRRRLGLGS